MSNNIRTIRVIGKGQIKVKPDMIRITITLKGNYKDYEETLQRSAQDTSQLKDILISFGFESSDLKTLSFNVNTDYESYKENGIYKQKFVGYEFRHIVKIEFEADNKQLGKILYALANCPMKPELRISYTVKNQEAEKNKLLSKAVNDAKEKAEVLADAANVMLKEIQSIDYSWKEIDFQIRPMSTRVMEDTSYMMEADYEEESYNIDINPDDIEVSDTVTVVWEIA